MLLLEQQCLVRVTTSSVRKWPSDYMLLSMHLSNPFRCTTPFVKGIISYDILPCRFSWRMCFDDGWNVM